MSNTHHFGQELVSELQPSKGTTHLFDQGSSELQMSD